ncbi:MAG: hypothetical protein QM762_29380 [Chryseolinea sp.]
MKLITRTRRRFYVANVLGILIVAGLSAWLTSRALAEGGIDFSSLYLWLALLALIVLLFLLIGFLSSMKAVEVTAKGIIITYIFQKHRNVIPFTDMAEVKTQKSGTGSRQSSFRETFMLLLKDGRSFEFERSQFDSYEKLKEVCARATARK